MSAVEREDDERDACDLETWPTLAWVAWSLALFAVPWVVLAVAACVVGG